MLTLCSWAFIATVSEVFKVAEVARLSLYVAPWLYVKAHPEKYLESSRNGEYFMFQDSQTGGGGCRVVFSIIDKRDTDPKGLAWISRHGGYPEADITTEVSQLFDMQGCRPYTGPSQNPHLYT